MCEIGSDGSESPDQSAPNDDDIPIVLAYLNLLETAF